MSNYALSVKWDILRYISGQGLDIGCGDSRPHDWMVGVDLHPGTGSRGPNLILDATKLSVFADKSQDFVFSSYLLNELDDWQNVLAEWWRLVKDDGYLILFLPIIEAKDDVKEFTAKMVVDAMVPLRPWQFVEARMNNNQLFHVYRKCDKPTTLAEVKPEKVCAVVKLGAHGDALWASSVLPGLKEQGYHVIMYTQTTGETVLRHDPHIDEMICFESRVPMGELGELFQWLNAKYKDCRILVECCEGTLLPSPQKIQYHWPLELRHTLMNMSYLDMHHMVAQVPLYPKRQKFYPSAEEAEWANELRARLNAYVVVVVPNGSSVTKSWPYAPELVAKLLERDDVTVVVLGDKREAKYEPHPNLLDIGMDWDVRKAMTFVQLSNVVAGEETGLLNSVGFNKDVHKVVLMTHSSVENLTKDWPSTDAIRTYPKCAGESGCHRLHYDFTYCEKDEKTGAAACQAMITVDMVMDKVEPYLIKEKIMVAA